jgi:hypothetical protein
MHTDKLERKRDGTFDKDSSQMAMVTIAQAMRLEVTALGHVSRAGHYYEFML